MGLNQRNQSNKTYAVVIADGSIRVQVEAGTPGAVLRKWENRDGTKGEKWELVFNNLDGQITDIRFKDTDFGKGMEIDVNDGKSTTCLCLNLAMNFAQDLMKKLPRLNLSKDLTLTPYSMEKENGKMVKGISVRQGGEKIPSFFYDIEVKKNINGYPEVDQEEAKKYDSDDWKGYFIGVRKFLVKYTEKNILPRLEKREVKLEDFTAPVESGEEVIIAPDFDNPPTPEDEPMDFTKIPF